jgi:hypothetical protein
MLEHYCCDVRWHMFWLLIHFQSIETSSFLKSMHQFEGSHQKVNKINKFSKIIIIRNVRHSNHVSSMSFESSSIFVQIIDWDEFPNKYFRAKCGTRNQSHVKVHAKRDFQIFFRFISRENFFISDQNKTPIFFIVSRELTNLFLITSVTSHQSDPLTYLDRWATSHSGRFKKCFVDSLQFQIDLDDLELNSCWVVFVCLFISNHTTGGRCVLVLIGNQKSCKPFNWMFCENPKNLMFLRLLMSKQQKSTKMIIKSKHDFCHFYNQWSSLLGVCCSLELRISS